MSGMGELRDVKMKNLEAELARVGQQLKGLAKKETGIRKEWVGLVQDIF